MKLRSKLHMEPYLLNKYYGGSQSQIKSGVRLPGTAGNYISTPDSVLNSVTGDIDIRVFAKADDWTPTAGTTFISRWNPAPNRQFTFALDTSGKIQFGGSIDGSIATVAPFSVNPVPFADGTAGWVRVTLDVDNGSGQSQIRYYTSVDGITWTSLGDPAAGTGVISLFDSTNPIVIGSNTAAGTAANFAGTIYYAEIRNGIDGPIVAKFDSSQVQVSGAQLPATINGWTWNGAALYKRDDYVRLPGTSGNYLSFPDTVANSVTGDIDIRVHVSADNWLAASIQTLIAKWDSAGVSNRAFMLRIDATTGVWGFFFSTTGLDTVQTNASPLALTNGVPVWLRATRVQATGIITFYTSPDGVTWTTTTTSGAVNPGTPMFDGSQPLQIGAQNAGGTNNLLIGNVYYAEVRNGINGPIAASFNGADNQVQTPWTINGAAWNWEGSSFVGKPAIALSLPGVASNYVSTPDTAGNSILGDIDLRMKVALPDWTPSSTMTFIGKNVGDPNRAFRWTLLTPGTSQLEWWPTGSNASIITKISTVAIPFADGATGWVRVTLDVDNGASGNTVSFYTSIDGVVWTPLGAPVITAGVTTMVDTAAAIEVGANFNGASQQLLGTVYYAEVRNGIDGPIVAKFDPTNMAKTGTRTPASTVQPGGTPNLLTPNQASIETDATGWAAGTNATIAQDATQFLDGTKSLAVTAVAVGSSFASTTAGPRVAPGKLYTATAWFKAGVTGRAVQLFIDWYSDVGGYISTSAVIASGTDVSGSWTATSGSIVAPAGVGQAGVKVKINDATQVLGEVHYVDRVSLVEAAEVWTINGSAWDLVAA